jgi:hypothetical protein
MVTKTNRNAKKNKGKLGDAAMSVEPGAKTAGTWQTGSSGGGIAMDSLGGVDGTVEAAAVGHHTPSPSQRPPLHQPRQPYRLQ